MTNRISASVDDEVFEYLQTKDNISAYIERLVEADMKGVDTDTIGLELQERHLEKEAQAALERHERVENQLEEIREMRKRIESTKDASLEKARESLEYTPKDPTNEAIQKWAKRVDMTPEQLCNELQQQS